MKNIRAAKTIADNVIITSASNVNTKIHAETADVFCDVPSTSGTNFNMCVNEPDVLLNGNLACKNNVVSQKEKFFEINNFEKRNNSTPEYLSEMEMEEEQSDTSETPIAENISDRRFVDIAYFIKSLKSLQHEGFGCSFFNMDIIAEKRLGFASVFTVKCLMCHKVDTVCNYLCYCFNSAGYKQLSEFTSTMDIPTISSATYANYHDNICDIYNRAATNSMAKAAQEEVKLAKRNGEVDSEGYPTIAVVADCHICMQPNVHT
ncbi:hypothetical protein FQR65_LT08980 [Abscondita terminalis]|nr:hypothetical protein FQR65_LT08980 [Abscondita terminalis]